MADGQRSSAAGKPGAVNGGIKKPLSNTGMREGLPQPGNGSNLPGVESYPRCKGRVKEKRKWGCLSCDKIFPGAILLTGSFHFYFLLELDNS